MCSFLVIPTDISKTIDIDNINQYLRLRGPDYTNALEFEGYIFLHNLLHICGTITPQPFICEKSRTVALFNGQIYNYRNFDQNFQSDGECLIPLYQEYGESFTEKLDGEFAIVLFDFENEKIILSSDIFATKPLHYGIRNNKIFISSFELTLRRILSDNEVTIKKVPHNRSLVLDLKSLAVLNERRIFNFNLDQYKDSYDDWNNSFDNAILKRTRSNNNSNKKIFTTLSSGQDSGIIVCCLEKLKVDFSSYTYFGREDVETLEKRLAGSGQRNCKVSSCVSSTHFLICGRRLSAH